MNGLYRIVCILMFCSLISMTFPLPVIPACANGKSPEGESVVPSLEPEKSKVSETKKKVKKKAPSPTKSKISKSPGKVEPSKDWKAGQILVEEGNYRTAIAFLHRYLKNNPPSADAWYWISRAHHALGDYDHSQSAANIALQIDPFYPALTETPSGLQPLPPSTRATRHDPPPSVAILPVKPVLPARIQLTPVPVSPPYLSISGDRLMSGDIPQSGEMASGLIHPPFAPQPKGRTPVWMQKKTFQELSRWRRHVDRMGILSTPRVPIAWKGNRPAVIFIWTGEQWVRIQGQRVTGKRIKERVGTAMQRAQSEIENFMGKKGFRWYESDTPALAAHAAQWRYVWMGTLYIRVSAEQNLSPHTGDGIIVYELDSSGTLKVKKRAENTGKKGDITGPQYHPVEEDRIYQERIQWLPGENTALSPEDDDEIPANQLIFENVQRGEDEYD